ncbi:MAG: hypothetical protein ABI887_18200 [Burkholderiales bacterium]
MKLTDFRIGTRLGGGFAMILSLLAEEWFRNIAVGVQRTTAIAKSSDPSPEQLFAADAKASTERSEEILTALDALPGGEEDRKQSAAAAASMKEQAVRLATLVGTFRLSPESA